MLDVISAILIAAGSSSTAILLAAMGGLVNRQGGIINIGLEGMMLGGTFAAATGIGLAAVIIGAMLASGVLGGLAGGLQVLGVNYRFIDRFSPGYGFTGIAVALLGRNTPLGVLLAALFFGALANGGAMIQLFSDIPIDLINLLQGTVMILAVVQFGRLRAVRVGRA